MSYQIGLRISIENLLAVYVEQNSAPNFDSNARFLCNLLKDHFHVTSDLTIETNLREYFSRYFNLLDDHERYSVVPLWFSRRNEEFPDYRYNPVSLKAGGVLHMDGINNGMQFRIKLMEYIVAQDPNSELTFSTFSF